MSGADAKNWRKTLGLMRTAGALKADPLDGRRAGEAVDRAKTEALQAAAQNPDHSEAGRTAALTALKVRNIALEPWRLSVPGYLSAADLARGESLFFGWSHGLRAALALMAVASGAAAATALVLARSLAGPVQIAFAASLLVWAGLSALRLKPARVALLRASAARMFAHGARAFIGTELCGFGHVFALARPEAARGRFERVASAQAYRGLALSMRHLTALNLASATGAAASAPAIRATPAWAGLTELLLWDCADVAVIDLSGAAETSTWPLELVRAHGAAGCVFVALWGQAEAAQAALKRAGINAFCHLYAPDGHMLDRARFRAAMIAAMRARRGSGA